MQAVGIVVQINIPTKHVLTHKRIIQNLQRLNGVASAIHTNMDFGHGKARAEHI